MLNGWFFYAEGKSNPYLRINSPCNSSLSATKSFLYPMVFDLMFIQQAFVVIQNFTNSCLNIWKKKSFFATKNKLELEMAKKANPFVLFRQ